MISHTSRINRKIERTLDTLVPYRYPRWAFTLTFFILFFTRVCYLEEYFAIAYLLAFDILKKSIAFMTPKGIPSIIDEEDSELILPDVIPGTGS